MAGAPQMAAAFARIDAEMRQAVRATKRLHAVEGALRYVRDPRVRARTLTRLSIDDGEHYDVIKSAKELLRIDGAQRRAGGIFVQPPVHRWALFAVWIGERHLARNARARAMHTAHGPLMLAAE